jgi:tRNA 2-selenouridine synthase
MLLNKINVLEFLELAETIPVVDVRSPSEFTLGHIPGAVNIPLFNDQERAAVGTKYKKEGRVPAILEGLGMVGPQISSKLEQALKIARGGSLLVHCWRGGMRSEAMAWLFSLGDIETHVLEGGYKSFRQHILADIEVKRKMIILGGLTGSSKTHILKYIKESGHQMIDLEGLANHKGSAFGALGQPQQPSTEQFSNLLFYELKQIDNSVPFWVEDESRNIGSVFMPDGFYFNMQESPVVIILMDVKLRLPRLIEEYSKYPADTLKDSVMKISKRLGGNNTKDAINAIDSGDFAKAIEITLFYYDKTYRFGLTRKHSQNIIFVDSDTDNIEINAKKILEAASKIIWP